MGEVESLNFYFLLIDLEINLFLKNEIVLKFCGEEDYIEKKNISKFISGFGDSFIFSFGIKILL